MNQYERIFGIGPVILVVGIVLLVITSMVRRSFMFDFTMREEVRYFLIIFLVGFLVICLVYSIRSLPIQSRGNELITTGAFSFVRHPLYSSFLLFLPPILILLTRDYIYAFTGILLVICAHLLLKIEEKSIMEYFGEDYFEYQKRVPMLIPYKILKL